MGMRRSFSVDRKDVPSNYLFRDMIHAIDKLQPKAFLFENVSGLMRGRWTPEGEKGEIWTTVHKAFKKFGKEKDYDIHYDVLHAKDYGVPQNRPRIILIGIKKESVTPPC